MKNKQPFSGWAVAAGSAVIIFFLVGFFSTSGVILPFIAGLRQLPMSLVGLCVTASTGAAVVGNMFVEKVVRKIGPRSTLLIAVLSLPVRYVLLALAPNVWMMYFSSIFCGLGISFSITPISMLITAWFVKKRVMILSMIYTTAGFGAAVAIPLLGFLLEKYSTLPAVLIISAIVLAACIPACLFLIKDYPEKIGQKPYGWEAPPPSTSAGAPPPQSHLSGGVSVSAARRSLSFWLLIAGVLLSCMCLDSVLSYAGAFWQDIGMNVSASANYLGMFSLFGAFAGILVGILSDKFGAYFFTVITHIPFIVGVFLIVTVRPSGPLMIVSLLLLSFVFPITGNLPSIATMAIFGRKSYDKILGTFQAVAQLGAALMPFLFAIFLEVSGYALAFHVMQIACAAGLVLNILALLLAPIRKKARPPRNTV